MAKIETLTSPANPLLKKLRRAEQQCALTDDGYCLAETYHLLEEALRSRCEIAAVLTTESERPRLESRLPDLGRARVVILPDAVFRDAVSTQTSQGVLALVRPPSWKPRDIFRNNPLVVVLDGLQDPGNAGTIVRTAEAFGASGIIFLKGTTSPYSAKAVRASAGSLFRLPLLCGLESGRTRELLKREGLRIYAAAAGGDRTADQVDLAAPCAIVVGSEGHGIGPEFRAGATVVGIPTVRVESLNAAMAAGILLYEARRQRAGVR